MHIHQVSVHHDERQDRLLLRLNTQDNQEFRFWLTRRMAQRFLPALAQSAERLEAAQPGVAATDTAGRQILTELRRDDFLKKADFATPFENHASEWPLGQAPLLVTDAHMHFKPQGGLDLSLEDKSDPAQSKACQLHLHVSLVHGLVHLMTQAAEKAQWGLNNTTHATPTPWADSAAEPSGYAH